MVSDNTKLMEAFRHIVETRHEYAEKWKGITQGKVCGFLSNMVPEEFLYAANVLPVRIFPDYATVPKKTSRHIQVNRCACCRGSLEEGLLGNYDYLDGIVYEQTCLAQSLAFSSWVKHVPTKWNYRMFGPWRDMPSADAQYKNCMDDFKKAVEKWCGVTISEDALGEALAVYSENRRLISKVYDLRKHNPPLIKGSEAQQIVLASMLMDKKEHNELLKKVLEKTGSDENKQEGVENPVRVMIVGSGMSPMDYMELLESLDTEVVIEDHCLGLRYFWGEDQDKDKNVNNPEDAILNYYHKERAKCAYQDWMAEKTKLRMKDLVTDYNVDAVIWLAQKYCGTWQWIIPEGLSLFESMNIPALKIERGRVIIKKKILPELEEFLNDVKKNRVHEGGAV